VVATAYVEALGILGTAATELVNVEVCVVEQLATEYQKLVINVTYLSVPFATKGFQLGRIGHDGDGKINVEVELNEVVCTEKGILLLQKELDRFINKPAYVLEVLVTTHSKDDILSELFCRFLLGEFGLLLESFRLLLDDLFDGVLMLGGTLLLLAVSVSSCDAGEGIVTAQTAIDFMVFCLIKIVLEREGERKDTATIHSLCQVIYLVNVPAHKEFFGVMNPNVLKQIAGLEFLGTEGA